MLSSALLSNVNLSTVVKGAGEVMGGIRKEDSHRSSVDLRTNMWGGGACFQ